MTAPRADAETLLAAGLRRPLGTTRLRRTLRQRLLSHPLAVASAALLLALALLVLAAPLIGIALRIDSETPNLLMRMQPPSAAHWLGTDELGRDLLMRLLEGGRVSLGIGLIIAAAAAVIGTLVGWTTVARLVRGATLSLREREFVRAALALGAGPVRIMFVHILPNVMGPIVVSTTLSVGGIILLESVLSFLGLGIQPPMASWGNMLTNAQDLIWSAPALAIWPGLMIFVTVICCNFLGDGLQDALDPRA